MTPPNLRFKALSDVLGRQPKHVQRPSSRISDYFGSNVFNEGAMRMFLTEDAYRAVRSAIERGERIDRRLADQVASGMKEWAASKGATHYTHWFQPLNGSSAEKHDAFFEPLGDGRSIERFDGGMLVQQEPDASSFPSGGIRNTFEARGYTAWDPGSPAFLINQTLCIPTIFVSYTGEALDFKTPLLRSVRALDEAATAVCRYFDKNVGKVIATLGWEQEYFLIDESFYFARPDIMMAGRALFGHGPARGQQLEDHYFGSIPERTQAYMRDFETEALQLGIPVKTRHNEVAPNQFECAPVYEEMNLAVDHNMLLMDVMEKTARKHDMRVLFHEKPYAGVNGSGKHNNWSLATDTGVNLLRPAKTPKENIQFLAFFVSTIAAVHDHADVLRASIASANNDHRLGANEAPPAIISVFIGEYLTGLLDELEKSVKASMSPASKTELKLDIGRIPQVLLDNTDRNRTSPIAFTGNKFEFRAVGSSANCAAAMTVLNTVVAAQLKAFKISVDALIAKGVKKDEAILRTIRDLIAKSKPVRFEGNGYGEEWKEEAAKRGLRNVVDTPRALDAWAGKATMKVFKEMGVLTDKEIKARHDIELHSYTLKVQIESRVCADMAMNHVLPAAVHYQNRLITNVQGLRGILGKEAGEQASATQLDLIQRISGHIEQLRALSVSMTEARKTANVLDDQRAKAIAYCDTVKPFLDLIRYHSNKLELLVDDELWPLPKMRELLFTR
ncbi:MAG: glutamine synthetase III [Flavobacteriales bacterium]|jgi:glutamine synthetase|nr:glutamine synthetase III [Flavobacteriales bacterium]MBK6893660.1 glutamine synthetase III [Flavobacteriales bacterium]MBK7248629.1 glutamine synthetase III [Flavobacteriales bacterium]MBK9597917.1 glutamine synthetase III [Flavobacteriales bacterium]QQS73881.1 MAG: glutamine synthetase III [Flavobacteriales bacterium]